MYLFTLYLTSKSQFSGRFLMSNSLGYEVSKSTFLIFIKKRMKVMNLLTFSVWNTFLLILLSPHGLLARPTGPQALCDAFDLPQCDGTYIDCTPCHTAPPARDFFGQALEDALWPGMTRPESDQDFYDQLLTLLPTLENVDSDGDGVNNLAELQDGFDPGDPQSVPPVIVPQDPCINGAGQTEYDVCAYDPRYVYKKVSLDFCGKTPQWSDFESFLGLNDQDQKAALHDLLDACLQSTFWLGKEGVLWQMAHKKIRPLQAIKSGQDPGRIQLGDYDPDYRLFTYIMSGDRDVRDLLRADYFVNWTSEDPPRFERTGTLNDQNAVRDRRAGLITSRWFFVINTMFTPVPRTTAAQAYRAYLGLDIAQSQGLIEPPTSWPELTDYDEKGITEPGCAACHRTLDPLSYPFSRYQGISGNQSGGYDAQRMTRFGPEEGQRIAEVPERGSIFGQEVEDLIEWSIVASNSDAFAKKVILDFWTLLIGHSPKSPTEQEAYDLFWNRLKTENQYQVNRFLHDLIDSEVYGVP